MKRRRDEEESDSDSPTSDKEREVQRKLRATERELAELQKESKKALDSVFDTPPSKIDEETFYLLHPFLQLKESVLPAYNHVEFDGSRSYLFEQAATAILSSVQDRMTFFSRSISGEQDRHHMLHLLEMVGLMSRQEKNLKLKLGSVEYRTNPEQLDSSDEDLKKLDVNQKVPKTDDARKLWRMDIGCSIQNRQMLSELNKVDSSALWQMDKWKWLMRLVIECKEGPIAERDMCQAVMYAIAEAKSRFLVSLPIDPIYFQVWTPTHWRYGVVDLKGFVRLKNRKLEKKSLNDFEKTLTARKERRGPKEEHYAHSDLAEILERNEDSLLKIHQCRYRDGWYPVGTIYWNREDLKFPNLRVTQLDNDGKRFFQCLLRTLLGNKTLQMDPDELVSNFVARKQNKWTDPPPNADLLLRMLKAEASLLEQALWPPSAC